MKNQVSGGAAAGIIAVIVIIIAGIGWYISQPRAGSSEAAGPSPAARNYPGYPGSGASGAPAGGTAGAASGAAK